MGTASTGCAAAWNMKIRPMNSAKSLCFDSSICKMSRYSFHSFTLPFFQTLFQPKSNETGNTKQQSNSKSPESVQSFSKSTEWGNIDLDPWSGFLPPHQMHKIITCADGTPGILKVKIRKNKSLWGEKPKGYHDKSNTSKVILKQIQAHCFVKHFGCGSPQLNGEILKPEFSGELNLIFDIQMDCTQNWSRACDVSSCLKLICRGEPLMYSINGQQNFLLPSEDSVSPFVIFKVTFLFQCIPDIWSVEI